MTISILATSLPWRLSSTRSFSSILRCRSKGALARFPNCSLPLQNFSPGISLTTFQLCIRRVQFSRLSAPSFTFWMSWGFELATRTPVTWIEIFSRRLSLWQQQQLLQPPNFLAVPPPVLAGCSHHQSIARRGQQSGIEQSIAQ